MGDARYRCILLAVNTAEERLDSLLRSLAKETLATNRDEAKNEAAALSPSSKAQGTRILITLS